MSLPSASEIDELITQTWPALRLHDVGPWRVRETPGQGGTRTIAATAEAPVTVDDLPLVEQAQRDLDQPLVIRVTDADKALNDMLESAGYQIAYPVVAYGAPVALFTEHARPAVTTFEAWPVLAVQAEIWAEGGIGPDRLAVMDRVGGPKTSLLGRVDDAPAACAFVGCHAGHAMLHALETRARHRRRGLGRHVLRAAGHWAAAQGAASLSLLVTRTNEPANALYLSMGMVEVGGYHYRIKRE